MPRIVKQALADQDLVDIWLYTFSEWGEKQADKYLDDMDIHRVDRQPASHDRTFTWNNLRQKWLRRTCAHQVWVVEQRTTEGGTSRSRGDVPVGRRRRLLRHPD